MAKHNIPYVNLPAQGRDQMEDLKKIFEQVVLKGSFVGTHDDLAALEKRLAEYCGTAEAIALNSGTDALLLAMLVSGIGEGDEVITPPNSFVASTATIVQLGATPVFADVLADQNVDPEKIARAITPRTKAVMPVHLTGRICQMDEIMELANRHGLVVIEDAAQAIGSMYKGRLAGSIGHFGCFSAHPLKNLNALGDGGFVTTNDKAAAERMRRLRAHGMADRQTIEEWGMVSRMDTLQAAILGYRLDKLPDVIAKRRDNAALYRSSCITSACTCRPAATRNTTPSTPSSCRSTSAMSCRRISRRSASRRRSTIRCPSICSRQRARSATRRAISR